MINIIEDLGKIYIGNKKQKNSCVLVECENCKTRNIVLKTRLKNKDKYICKSCSAKINLKLATEIQKQYYNELNKEVILWIGLWQ